MIKNETNCLIAQSGGPTAAINASLSGVIDAAIKNNRIDNVYGALHGIQGVIADKIIRLNDKFLNDNDIESLKLTPAMYLGSCRYKLNTSNEEEFKTIFNIFNKYNIKYFFYIGGNDSMDTVWKLSNYAKDKNIDVQILGIPKTIDNDLECTDHTPGFGSAAKFVASSLLEISHDTYIYNTKSVTIVEIMGRNAGWLTAASVLARNNYNRCPDLIYLPEVPFSKFNFLNDVRNLLATKNNVVIAVSEGIMDEKGNYVCASFGNATDQFGHAILSGTGKALEDLIRTAINCKVRSIELNILQRSAMHITSKTDLDESFLLGEKAVEFALNNITGKMLTIQRTSNTPYEIEIGYTDVNNVANHEKQIPREWINEVGNDVTQDLIDYLSPLIKGENQITYVDGLPSYIDISHLTE